jgi:DNA-binding NarL/FixJ family response regulator
MKIIQPYQFTEPELQMFREKCNFSEDEMRYFNLRAKHLSNLQISFEMNISTSTVSNIAKRVKNKMIRII